MSQGTSEEAVERQLKQIVLLVRCAVINEHPNLFDNSEVREARHALKQQFGSVLTVDQLGDQIDHGLVKKIATQIFDQRVTAQREADERMGVDSPCHLCGAARHLAEPTYGFGLARILEEKTEWGGAAATLALNILTLPLGFAVGARPGRSTRAQIIRCRMVLCTVCARQHTGFFSGLVVPEYQCERHPSWNKIVAAGFTRFYSEKELLNFREA